MTPPKYSRLNIAMQKIASTQFGARIFSRIQHYIDHAILRLTNNKATLTSLLAGLPVVMLTTTGAKSGQPRTVPLVAIRDNNAPANMGLVASNWGQKRYPAWYYNLKANPRARCKINGEAGEYVAREVSGEEYAHYWQLATEVYSGYPLYRQRVGKRHIPIFVLTPKERERDDLSSGGRSSLAD